MRRRRDVLAVPMALAAGLGAFLVALLLTGCHPTLTMQLGQDDPAVPALRAWAATATEELNDHERRLQALEVKGQVAHGKSSP